MSPLVKIRSERDRMSAVERRIADFILENSLLLRDYSSQQLANALGISQSSVVKFTQKLGFRGYPDLKYSVGEAIARADHGDEDATVSATPGARSQMQASNLWRRKTEAEEATRLINARETIDEAVEAIRTAGRSGKVFIIGLGEDDIYARGFALKLSLMGILTVHNFDTARMTADVSAANAGRRAAGVFRARPASGAVQDRAVLPRATRAGDHGIAAYLQPATHPGRYRLAGLRA